MSYLNITKFSSVLYFGDKNVKGTNASNSLSSLYESELSRLCF